MKKLAFDMNKAKWDAYRAFHIEHAKRHDYGGGNGAIVQFDTGEVVVKHYIDHHDLRRPYPELGITIASTTDSHFPAVMQPNGDKVAAAWLNMGGMYVCLIDHDTGKVHNLSASGDRRFQCMKQIPTRLQHLEPVAYWGGERNEIVAAPFALSLPADKDERDALADIVSACKAWNEMRKNDPEYKPGKFTPRTLDPRFVIQRGFADLSEDSRINICNGRVDVLRKTVTVPYLVTSEGN